MGLLRWLFGLPDRDAFARKVQQGLRASGEVRPTRYDPAEFWEPIKQPSRDGYILEANRL